MESYNRVFLDDKSTALVLEGGAMRTIFTVGVLDFFMENEIEFPYTIGVSGGATNGLSYMSKQKGRSHYINILLQQERPYMGLSTLIKTGRLIDLKFLFSEMAFNIYPFDTAAYFSNPNIFEVVSTHCETGEAHYLSERLDPSRLLQITLASCSLPIISPVVDLNGEPMTDGGLADSIPLIRALEQGYSHAIVVLTQNKGYRKKTSRFKIPWLFLPKYPKVREMLNSRADRYNKQLEFVEQMEREGRITIFRPQKALKVGRFTKDANHLQELYDEGYAIAKSWYEGLNGGDR